MPRPAMTFWFEFASTYSYLSVMRLPAMARAAGVSVRWRPFLLGPIFAAQGWSTSPFTLYPAKGAYMWRDMARRCAELGLDFARPAQFPANGLLAARVAQVALTHPRGETFCQTVFGAQFAEARDIADPVVIADCAARTGLPADMIEIARSDTNKAALRATTDAAAQQGLFGAPSFTIGDELFWGDDRLEAALAHAQRI